MDTYMLLMILHINLLGYENHGDHSPSARTLKFYLVFVYRHKLAAYTGRHEAKMKLPK
jgi:hypothetical protein